MSDRFPPASGADSASKLSTGDVFSDWVVSGCVGAVSSGTVRHSNVIVNDFVADSVAISPDGAYLYVQGSQGNGSKVYKVSTSTFTVVSTYTPSSASQDVAYVFTDGTYVYSVMTTASDVEVHKITSADMSTVSTATVISGGTLSRVPDITPDNSRIVCTDGTSVFIATLSGLVTTSWTPVNPPVCVTARTDSAVVVLEFDGDSTCYLAEYGLDGSGRTVRVTGGTSTLLYLRSMRTSPNGVYVAASDQDNNVAKLFDLDGGSLLQSSSTGLADPYAPAWDGNTTAYFPLQSGSADNVASLDTSGVYTTYGLDGSAVNSSMYNNVAVYNSLVYVVDANDPGYSDMDVFTISAGTLSLTLPSGVAYVEGLRTTPTSLSHTFTASKDTYCFLQSDGTWKFSAVDNSDPTPTNTGLLVQKVVTDSSSITTVTQIAADAPRLLPLSGEATLASGTVDVTIPSVTTSDRILLQRVSGTSVNFGNLTYTITAGDKITINSDNASDDSVVNYFIFR